jgi:hypothetical protein
MIAWPPRLGPIWLKLQGTVIPELAMVKPITNHQLTILQFVGAHPGAERDQLMRITQATAEDLAYLEEHDMIREREPGHYRIAHFGEMVLRRT